MGDEVVNISVEREGAALKIKCTIYVPGSGAVNYIASLDLGNEYYAGFVREAIATQFGEGLRKLLEEFYGDGWREAKAKRSPKEKWFSSMWNP